MLRFTLRDLFWFTLVVAMGVGWWVDRGRLTEAERRAELWELKANRLAEMVRTDGWMVYFDDEFVVAQKLTDR